MTDWLLWLLAAIYAAALGWLLWVAHKKRGLYAAAKGLCSAIFLACALLAWVGGARGDRAAFALLLGALTLCAFGDVLLGLANKNATRVSKKPFLLGALSFSLAHVVFCVLYFARQSFHWAHLVLPLCLVAVLWALERRDAVRLKKMRAMAYVYTFLVGLMAAGAAGFGLGAAPLGWLGLFLVAGAALFLVSDVILLFLYFGTHRKKWHRTANLLTYYCGVFLLALAARWL